MENGGTVAEGQFRPQLGEPHHHAYVVDDIEAIVERLAERLGAGPFFLVENVPLENVRSRGGPAEFAHDSAFGFCGDGAIELIRPTRLTPDHVEERFAGVRPRIHHVGYVVPAESAPELRNELDDRDLSEYLASRLGELDMTLHDASALLGHDIEIHVDNEGLRDFFGMVRDSAEDWDGATPLRPAPR
jgi:Glyoxalase/Bleomycin resistance protein/Dioxygenase superfamily